MKRFVKIISVFLIPLPLFYIAFSIYSDQRFNLACAGAYRYFQIGGVTSILVSLLITYILWKKWDREFYIWIYGVLGLIIFGIFYYMSLIILQACP